MKSIKNKINLKEEMYIVIKNLEWKRNYSLGHMITDIISHKDIAMELLMLIKWGEDE